MMYPMPCVDGGSSAGVQQAHLRIQCNLVHGVGGGGRASVSALLYDADAKCGVRGRAPKGSSS